MQRNPPQKNGGAAFVIRSTIDGVAGTHCCARSGSL